jgi:ubiquinol-cytochrome c reductase cytochrome b subunit
VIGVLLLLLAIANGFFGYSLLDDLLSGTGVRVANAIMLSIPLIGPWLASLFFGGEFPSDQIIPRFFVLHVLILPAVIVGLLSAHLGLVWRQKHTQFAGPGRTETNIAGSRLWPAYAMKSVGLFFVVSAVLAGLGGLFQINPIWVYGPFFGSEANAAVTYASQPDWYMGWLDGALRLFPAWEVRIGWFRIPNPFWPGVLLPGIVFTALFLWPFIEARLTHDDATHNLLDRPRDRPLRTAFGTAALTFFAILFFAGSNDILASVFATTPEAIVKVLQWLLIPLPLVAGYVAGLVCRELKSRDLHPVVGVTMHHVRRAPSGGYVTDGEPSPAGGDLARHADDREHEQDRAG